MIVEKATAKKIEKIRVIKSDLKELQGRVNVLTGNDYDISIGIDGVEGVEDDDGRMVINDLPKDWELRSVLKWVKSKIRSRYIVNRQMSIEMEHLEFVKELIEKQISVIEQKD